MLGRQEKTAFRPLSLGDVDDLLDDGCVVEVDLALGRHRDGAVLQGKEGVIPAHADVLAREDIRTALADEDGAYTRRSTRSHLNTEVFRI